MDKKAKLERLSPIQRHVTQENGTERPFENEYWDFFGQGLYLDIVSDEVLFSSKHKFKSECGWPSFYKAIGRENIIQKSDTSHMLNRVEVRSKLGDSHLGHIFTDGPAPTGLRYCINSAALKFIPLSQLEKFNLEEYKSHFDKAKEGKGDFQYLTLGAGCFWGVEAILSKTEGVLEAVSGYSGGELANPSYEQICTGKTGHAEVVQVKYDQSILSTQDLLELFFKLHDPTTLNSQGVDIGTQYRSVIYFHDEKQKKIADVVKEKMQSMYKNPIVTEIQSFGTFYAAEDYHQDYYDKKYSGGFGPICHFVRGE